MAWCTTLCGCWTFLLDSINYGCSMCSFHIIDDRLHSVKGYDIKILNMVSNHVLSSSFCLSIATKHRHPTAAVMAGTSAACHGPDLDLLDLAGDLAEVGSGWPRFAVIALVSDGSHGSDLMGWAFLGWATRKTKVLNSWAEDNQQNVEGIENHYTYSRASRDLWDMGQSSPVSNGALNPCKLWTSVASRMGGHTGYSWFASRSYRCYSSIILCG